MSTLANEIFDYFYFRSQKMWFKSDISTGYYRQDKLTNFDKKFVNFFFFDRNRVSNGAEKLRDAIFANYPPNFILL